MSDAHVATATLAFQLVRRTSDAHLHEQIHSLCQALGISCNSDLLEALTSPSLGTKLDAWMAMGAKPGCECGSWKA